MTSVRNGNYLVRIQVMGSRLGDLKRVVEVMTDSVRHVKPIGREDRNRARG